MDAAVNRSRNRVWITIALVAGVAGFAGFRLYESRRYQSEVSQAEADLTAGRYPEARDRLARLAARWPGRDEIESPLGAAESALGHVDAALDAWARVPRESGLMPRVALARAKLALEHGRLAAAEESLDLVADRSDPIGDEASRLAWQLDLYSGRQDRINTRIERRWRSAPDQAALLRTHWLIETQPFPAAKLADSLEKFGREAPEDDRVWLGLADLATRAGRFDEADTWLTRCEARRPDDFDVARARLTWALDAGRPSAAARVLAKLPASRFRRDEIEALTARFANLRGDPQTERAALERLVALKPGDAAAWKRLADLASAQGPAGAELRDRANRRKSELDRVSDEYRRLIGQVAAAEIPDPRPLARAAESLGRRFEARGWWSLAGRHFPGDPEALAALQRLEKSDEPSPASSPRLTLADLIPDAASGSLDPGLASTRATLVVPAFRDDAESSGLRFVYNNDQSDLRRLPETMGGGLALLDFDSDGLLDVYAVQGGKFPPDPKANEPNGDRLFRNRGDGTFEDVSKSSGIASFKRGFGHGVVVGDIDNDGHPDLFLTRWRSYALYRNRGDGTFEDATERFGLGGERGWPTSAAFGDLDGDGDLDLYVCHYLHWDPENSPPCDDADHPGRHVYCVPRAFESEPDHVFRNDGGRFIDVSKESGLTAADTDGRGLGVVIADLDGDAKVDIFVTNDMTANDLYRNLGGFRFEEVGESSGVASNVTGGYQAGMGIACGDADGDSLPDLVVTNFYGESVTFYKNLGGGLFADRTTAVGLAAPTRFVLGFGAFFLDADNDGYLDLAIANGHVNDYRPSLSYEMPSQLFLGSKLGKFTDASAASGRCWTEPRVGRGLAVGDLDNDGRPDVLILSQNSPLAAFHNLGPSGHWLTLHLEGSRSNRDAVGALVRVTAAGRTQTASRIGGGSFLSASDSRLHFGLGQGPDAPPATVEIQWPSGLRQHFDRLASDTSYRIIEGNPTPR